MPCSASSPQRRLALAGCPAAPQEAPLASGCAALPLRPHVCGAVAVRGGGGQLLESFPGWGRW